MFINCNVSENIPYSKIYTRTFIFDILFFYLIFFWINKFMQFFLFTRLPSIFKSFIILNFYFSYTNVDAYSISGILVVERGYIGIDCSIILSDECATQSLFSPRTHLYKGFPRMARTTRFRINGLGYGLLTSRSF